MICLADGGFLASGNLADKFQIADGGFCPRQLCGQNSEEQKKSLCCRQIADGGFSVPDNFTDNLSGCRQSVWVKK